MESTQFKTLLVKIGKDAGLNIAQTCNVMGYKYNTIMQALHRGSINDHHVQCLYIVKFLHENDLIKKYQSKIGISLINSINE